MRKITFKNYGDPGISAEILEALQNNIEEAIEESVEKNSWTEIANVNLSEGNSTTYTQLIQAKEVMILHEKLNIYLVTIIPRQLSGLWVKNQNMDIEASMFVDFSSGKVSNGSTADTTTWIKSILYR